jgi:hypothetical protein
VPFEEAAEGLSPKEEGREAGVVAEDRQRVPEVPDAGRFVTEIPWSPIGQEGVEDVPGEVADEHDRGGAVKYAAKGVSPSPPDEQATEPA